LGLNNGGEGKREEEEKKDEHSTQRQREKEMGFELIFLLFFLNKKVFALLHKQAINVWEKNSRIYSFLIFKIYKILTFAVVLKKTIAFIRCTSYIE